jgi:predicted transposase/invertase (TIGR01784 family)
MGGETMSRDILPVNDLLFRKVFSSEGHEEVTRGFISDMLGIEVGDLSYANPYDIGTIRREMESDPILRHTEIDVRVRLSDGTQAVIEMQRRGHRGWDRRALYYSASRYTADIGTHERGGSHIENYLTLCPTHGINVLDFPCFRDDGDALRTFTLYDVIHRSVYGDGPLGLLSLTFFELGKEPDPAKANLGFWRMMFRGGRLPDDAPAHIRKAQGMADRVNLSEEEVEMITAHEKAVLDYNSALDYARDEGEARSKLEIARRSLAKGIPIEDICEITGLDRATLEGLLN